MRRRHAAALAAHRPIIPTHAPAVLAGSLAGSLALLLTAVPADAAERRSADEPRRVALTPKPAVATATLTPTSTAAPQSHTVQPGDTVSGIASRYGLRTADVLAVNGLDRSSVIYPGQVLALTGTPSSTASPSPSTSAGVYTITAGDTVSDIASRHGVSTDAVLSANGLTRESIIYPGQTLTIPSAGMTPVASTTAVSPAPAPVASGSSYTITAGDTVSGIASRHGVSTDAVLSANGLTRESIIYPGQALTIPGGAVAAVPAVAAATVAGLDAEQTETARVIVRVGREAGVSDRGIAIALATGMVESWLRNLDWGDRDSLGVFQQRPSQGWGTEAEVRDLVRATKVFYGGAGDPNGSRTRGLLDIPGWEALGFSEAAQAVQISAYPDRYGQWEQQAYQWLAALG